MEKDFSYRREFISRVNLNQLFKSSIPTDVYLVDLDGDPQLGRVFKVGNGK